VVLGYAAVAWPGVLAGVVATHAGEKGGRPVGRPAGGPAARLKASGTSSERDCMQEIRPRPAAHASFWGVASTCFPCCVCVYAIQTDMIPQVLRHISDTQTVQFDSCPKETFGKGDGYVVLLSSFGWWQLTANVKKLTTLVDRVTPCLQPSFEFGNSPTITSHLFLFFFFFLRWTSSHLWDIYKYCTC
jgi:hypothetical protein